jgi:hypothetical protein
MVPASAVAKEVSVVSTGGYRRADDGVEHSIENPLCNEVTIPICEVYDLGSMEGSGPGCAGNRRT